MNFIFEHTSASLIYYFISRQYVTEIVRENNNIRIIYEEQKYKNNNIRLYCSARLVLAHEPYTITQTTAVDRTFVTELTKKNPE